MMKKICIVLVLLLLFSVPVCARAENYCSSRGARRQWADLSARYPKDGLIQTLHALWIGLCAKVKAREIDEKQAIDLFERARAAAVSARKEEIARDKKTERAGI